MGDAGYRVQRSRGSALAPGWRSAAFLRRLQVSVQGLSINLATVSRQFGFAEAVDACLAQGVTAIAPWRDQVEAIGLDEAARIVKVNGLRVTGYCRGGMFPATDEIGLAAA